MVEKLLLLSQIFKMEILIDLHNFSHMNLKITFSLSSVCIRRKYWIRKNFQHPVFGGFIYFEMSRTQFDHF